MDDEQKKKSFQYWFGLLDTLKLTEDEWCVVCPFGIGDTYFVCALAEEFIKYNGGRQFSVIVKPGQEDIPLLFRGISRVFVADEIDLEVIYQWASFRPGNLIIGHPRYYADRLLELTIGSNGVTLLDLYYHIFRLPGGTTLQKPMVPTGFRESAAAKFQAASLPEGRTVIIAPHANSSRTMPMMFWHLLAENLRHRGWAVATNTSPDNQAIIPGTIPVSFSLGEALPFAEIAGRVIAARSGLCDLLSPLEEKLTVIYLQQKWNSGTVLSGCGLKLMGLCERVREVEISADTNLMQVLETVVNDFKEV